jgi:Zn-dependent protease with chaperone function
MPVSLNINPHIEAAARPEELLAAFRTARIDKPPFRPLYILGLALVAGVMVLLPMVYVALIAALGYGVYYHTIHDATVLTHARGVSSGKGAAVIYIAPIVAGLIALAFMVKPLFAPRRRRPEPFTLDRASNPVLYAHVEVLCRLMGAPVPVRIDINEHANASAGFRGGWFSMIRGTVVLTIGLPLARGLNVRQLTGVLAHEFGHFTQRTAMRLGWIIGRINGWFARVVYERDSWDEQLAHAQRTAGHPVVMVIVAVIRGLVALTRFILKVLMHIAHAMSCFMSRQMEFDADAWQCRLAGSDQFERTYDAISRLGAAEQVVFGSMHDRWLERRMPDDLPGLVAATAAGFEPPMLAKIRGADDQQRARLFSTHPPRAQRIKAAEALGFEGAFTMRGPAAVLFADLDSLSRQATFYHYKAVLGNAVGQLTLVSSAGLVKERERERSRMDAAKRFTGDDRLLASLRLRLPTSVPALGDPRTVAAALREAQRRFAELAPGAIAAAERWDTTWEKEIAGWRAKAALAAGLPLKPDEAALGFKKGGDAELRCQMLRDDSDRSGCGLDGLQDAAEKRIVNAVRLLRAPGVEKKIPTAAEDLETAEAMLTALFTMNEGRASTRKIVRDLNAAQRLIDRLKTDSKNKQAIKVLVRTAHDLRQSLGELRSTLLTTDYPFPHAAGRLSLGMFIVESIPPEDDIGALLGHAARALDQFWPAYYKILGPLLSITVAVEDGLGLPPVRV